MVDVDFSASPAVSERRDFVHPDAVLAVVVRIDLRLEPAAIDESVLDLRNSVLRHQQIDVGEDSAARWRKFCEEVRATLEQDQRHIDALERPKQAVDLPRDQRIPMRDDVARRPQMIRRTRRNSAKQTGSGETGFQSSEHSGTPRHA